MRQLAPNRPFSSRLRREKHSIRVAGHKKGSITESRGLYAAYIFERFETHRKYICNPLI